MTERVKIGTVHVDAGVVMIGDPCYSVTGDASHHIKTWSEFCKKSPYGKEKYDVTEPYGHGLGLVVPTLYGDGSYPVYAELEGDRVARVTIDFDPSYPDDFDE
ncbi:hypothetical protein [Streptomyces parvus]|uniref:hypothetical protein n=1 Tax=Streptomyces parvus TaxID=66428 RepID=UPI003D70E8EA